jgi:D-sedoheptulose 7-phosphate isomerase
LSDSSGLPEIVAAEFITQALGERQSVLGRLAAESTPILLAMRDILMRSLNNGGKIVVFGNGGSAADAQHIVAEFVGRFRSNRQPLAALALSTDTAVLTCIGNDFGFEQIFSRQVEALVTDQDVVVALSTSGTSPNVIAALTAAKQVGAKCIGFTGADGGQFKKLVDQCLRIPSRDTALVQEGYLAAWHILCELIEQQILADNAAA